MWDNRVHGNPSVPLALLQKSVGELRTHGWVFVAAMGERALARVIAVAGDQQEAARLFLHSLDEAVTTRATFYEGVSVFYSSRLLVRCERVEDAAIASGSAPYRLTSELSPAYANASREIVDEIEATIDAQTGARLRAKGAAMSQEELIAWLRATLQSLTQA